MAVFVALASWSLRRAAFLEVLAAPELQVRVIVNYNLGPRAIRGLGDLATLAGQKACCGPQRLTCAMWTHGLKAPRPTAMS